jgi:two-component system alkaline phosphatase synthesis response regulator PhoP
MENKIIIIEDDKDINSLIAYNLNKEGFSVEQVFDGNDAQARVAGEPFDIAILDIMLPGIDGFQICKAIKSRSDAFKTFVIIVSAKTDASDKLYAHILGADYYLTKPFSVRTLINIAKELKEIKEKKFYVAKMN